MRFSESFTSTQVIQHKLARLSHEELFQEKQGKWSVIKHLYHCWMVERGVLAYIKLKTQDSTALVSVSVTTRFKFAFFFATLRLGVLKINAPAVVQKFPIEMSIADLMSKWDATRKQADAFFLDFPDDDAKKGIFRHVFIGRLDKKLTQQFIRLHLSHHLRLCQL